MISSQHDRPDQAKAYSSFRPMPPSKLLDHILSYLGEKISQPFERAVDVGCGTGQSTLMLAPHFESVLGCDVSKAQIHEAVKTRQANNIQYRITPAECLSVPDQSVQLLTAGTCLHWLDAKAFFKEAKRVLVPGGVLAVYLYCGICPVTDDEEKNHSLWLLTNKIHYEDLKAYRSPNVEEASVHYKNIEFPFDNVTRIHNITNIYKSSAVDAAGYMRSVAAFQNFFSAHPQKADDLLQTYQDSIKNILNITGPLEHTSIGYRADYSLILCRDEMI